MDEEVTNISFTEYFDNLWKIYKEWRSVRLLPLKNFVDCIEEQGSEEIEEDESPFLYNLKHTVVERLKIEGK